VDAPSRAQDFLTDRAQVRANEPEP
jgi:hypothetical protein